MTEPQSPSPRGSRSSRANTDTGQADEGRDAECCWRRGPERYPAGLEDPACPVPCGRGPSLDLVIHPGIQEPPPQTCSGTDSSPEGWFPPALVTIKVRFSLWGRCEFDMGEPKDSKQLGKASAGSPAEGPSSHSRDQGAEATCTRVHTPLHTCAHTAVSWLPPSPSCTVMV